MTDREREVPEERVPEAKVGAVVDDADWREVPSGAKHSSTTEIARGTPQKAPHAENRVEHRASGFQRTVGAIRTVLPLVQKVLPLLDGNVALAVANLLAPRLQGPPLDLQPMETAVTRMRSELGSLREGIATHEGALKRIGEQLETVQDWLERDATGQKEIAEDLRRVQKRVTVLAVAGLIVLVASIAANVMVLVRMDRILH
jgi:hypothetical protein